MRSGDSFFHLLDSNHNTDLPNPKMIRRMHTILFIDWRFDSARTVCCGLPFPFVGHRQRLMPDIWPYGVPAIVPLSHKTVSLMVCIFAADHRKTTHCAISVRSHPT